MNKMTAVRDLAGPQYDEDGYGWAMAQSALIRAGRVQDVDWANVAEEIETMGRSERRALRSSVTQLLMHMLKWEAQPDRRGKSWHVSILNHRRQAQRELEENPSLRRELDKIFAEAMADAKYEASKETGLDIDVFEKIDLTLADAFERRYERLGQD